MGLNSVGDVLYRAAITVLCRSFLSPSPGLGAAFFVRLPTACARGLHSFAASRLRSLCTYFSVIDEFDPYNHNWSLRFLLSDPLVRAGVEHIER